MHQKANSHTTERYLFIFDQRIACQLQTFPIFYWCYKLVTFKSILGQQLSLTINITDPNLDSNFH